MKNNGDADEIHEGGVDIALRRDMAVAQMQGESVNIESYRRILTVEAQPSFLFRPA